HISIKHQWLTIDTRLENPLSAVINAFLGNLKQQLLVGIKKAHAQNIRALHRKTRVQSQFIGIAGGNAKLRGRGNIARHKVATGLQVTFGILETLPGQRQQQGYQHDQRGQAAQPLHLPAYACATDHGLVSVTTLSSTPADGNEMEKVRATCEFRSTDTAGYRSAASARLR